MRIHISALAAALAFLFATAIGSAQTLGSGITYQGLLADNGVPANGAYDFEFVLYTVGSGGSPVQTITQDNVQVNGGLIDTVIDYGADAYNGQVKWVEVHVRPGASGGAYTVLSPRQALTGAPYALGLPMPFQRAVETGNADAFSIYNLHTGVGIHGTTSGTANAGVLGSGPAGGTGVQGESSSGTGVLGISSDAVGVYGLGVVGVQALGQTGVYATATNGAGVYGSSSAWDGVHGESTDYDFAGVAGFGGQYGVYGNGQNNGMRGDGGNTGVLGAGPSWGVYAAGDLGVTGDKNFVEPHPTDPSKEIHYVTLEGREANTFFRGTAQLVNGAAFIAIPDDFRIVTDSEGLTVQLTPVGGAANLYCRTRSLDGIEVGGAPDVVFDYQVIGVRRASRDFQPVVANRSFIPDAPGEMDMARWLKPENVQRLVSNGTLKADGSVNMETVHRLHWDQRPGWTDQPKQRSKSGDGSQ